MKRITRIVLPFLAVVAVITACNSGVTSAGTGLTSATVQTMINASIAPLQREISQLQSAAQPAVYIQAPNQPAVSTKEHRHAAGAACTGLGTLTGRPDSSDPLQTDNLSGVSCTGYYFTVSGAATSSDFAYVQPLPPSVGAAYTAPDCGGTPYLLASSSTISWNGVYVLGATQSAVGNGAVFTLGSSGGAIPLAYWMLPAGATAANINMLSFYFQGQCEEFSFTLPAYELLPNDPTTSGVPSAPIPGPVTIG